MTVLLEFESKEICMLTANFFLILKWKTFNYHVPGVGHWTLKMLLHLLPFITRKYAIICGKRRPIVRRYIH